MCQQEQEHGDEENSFPDECWALVLSCGFSSEVGLPLRGKRRWGEGGGGKGEGGDGGREEGEEKEEDNLEDMEEGREEEEYIGEDISKKCQGNWEVLVSVSV